MKKLTIALAALAMAAPLSVGVASAQTQRDVREARQDLRQERRDVRDARQDLRDARQAQRWNARSHNGYSYNGRWYYGEPTRQIMSHRSYEPGYRSWRRGDRLSAYDRQHLRRVDYRRERLREPPRGYHYVRTERGETLLVAIATGVILSAILSAN